MNEQIQTPVQCKSIKKHNNNKKPQNKLLNALSQTIILLIMKGCRLGARRIKSGKVIWFFSKQNHANGCWITLATWLRGKLQRPVQKESEKPEKPTCKHDGVCRGGSYRRPDPNIHMQQARFMFNLTSSFWNGGSKSPFFSPAHIIFFVSLHILPILISHHHPPLHTHTPHFLTGKTKRLIHFRSRSSPYCPTLRLWLGGWARPPSPKLLTV